MNFDAKTVSISTKVSRPKTTKNKQNKSLYHMNIIVYGKNKYININANLSPTFPSICEPGTKLSCGGPNSLVLLL